MRALLAGALVLLAAAGCGGGEEQPAGGTAVDAAEAGNTVAIADFEFDPPTITVDAGTEVTWKNSDQAAHTASAVNGSFDTGALDHGEEGACVGQTWNAGLRLRVPPLHEGDDRSQMRQKGK